jgi:uncharacterized protein (DUF488 family)
MTARLYTIGHSRHSPEQLVYLLGGSRVTKLVDVRRVPYSRFCPQFNRDRLVHDLVQHGIGYWHVEALGGLRDPSPGVDSHNRAWRNPFLRTYADHAQTSVFRDALDALCRVALQETCAIMCAEADWQQCHRQIISDYLIVRDFEVYHIRSDGAVERARITPFASVSPDSTLLYCETLEQQLTLKL